MSAAAAVAGGPAGRRIRVAADKGGGGSGRGGGRGERRARGERGGDGEVADGRAATAVNNG
ncbi:hypothetical protein GCM10023107_51360 [Actinoplanes octamycinicus]|nr:hypothetical protein Aoc01nite_04820 [Actinoplanes octamycinicus]